MNGKLTKLKTSNNEYVYPISVSDAVFVEPQKSLKTKLAELDAALGGANPNARSYVIELTRWGIKNDGTDALNTRKGINDALVWAKSIGYSHVVLPSGKYGINGPINMISGMHFEMDDDSTLQMEANSSPGYEMILFRQVNHAKLSGGKIVGDKKSHKYELNVKFVRGGVNSDGSLNNDPNFIRSEVIDRFANEGLLSQFRLWEINGINAPGYNFYQYKDTVSKDTFVNFRNNGGFAPAHPDGRGWFDTIDKANKMVFVIDITTSPLTDDQISNINAKVDNISWTHEFGIGVAILSSNYIEVEGIEISDSTGDGILTGIGVHYEDPTRYTQEEMGQHIYIHGCNIHHCRRQGISLSGPNDVFVYDNTIHHIGYADDGVTTDFRNGTAPMFGIDIESLVSEGNIPYKSIYLNKDGLETNYRIHIFNNYIHHNAKGHFVNTDGTHISLENNIFEGHNIGGIISYANQWYVKYINNTFIDCEIVVGGNQFVNGAVIDKGNLRLMDVQGAVIQNCHIRDGLFYGSSIYGYLGTPASVNVATGTFIYASSHDMGDGAPVSFEQWLGKVPAGISVDKVYYTVNVTSTTFQVSETKGGNPVVITDAGTPGFNISRYNYGRCYISNVVVEKVSLDDRSTGFVPLIAGGVIKNVTVKGCGLEIKPPDNYVGRPNTVESIIVLDGDANLDGSIVSNLKVMRIKTSLVGGDINLGSNSFYSRVIINDGFFQGVQVNFLNAYVGNSTFINAKIYKPDFATVCTVLSSYLENSEISLHWLTAKNSMTIIKCVFNNVSFDVSSSVRMIENTDMTTV